MIIGLFFFKFFFQYSSYFFYRFFFQVGSAFQLFYSKIQHTMSRIATDAFSVHQ